MNIRPGVFKWRVVVQCLVCLVLVLLPLAHTIGWTQIMGNFYAWNVLGLPLADPLGPLQVVTGGALPTFAHVLGAVIVLLVALVLGRVFCGWLCPYGLISEALWKICGRDRKAHNSMSWRWRVGLTMLGLGLCLYAGFPILNEISAPGLLSLAPSLGWGQGAPTQWRDGLLIFIATLAPVACIAALDMAMGQRWWCRMACPQALLLMLAAQVGSLLPQKLRLSLHWTKQCCSCQNEEPCAKACSLLLRPRGRGPSRAACMHCGACVDACSHRGKALNIGNGCQGQQ